MKQQVEKVKVTLTKSLIGRKPNHVKVANALGLRKVNKTVEHYLTPSIEGMIEKIRYMLDVEVVANANR